MFRRKNKDKLTLNDTTAPEITAPSIQNLVVNLEGLIRNDTMEGRPYKVIPMVMITEGVHNGSNGSLYYPEEELARIPAVWNMKPIVVYHPEKNGQGVSACSPDVLTNRKVGVIMNTHYRDGRLKAEAWLEEDRCDKVDKRILQRIEKKEMMEISTGVYTENENTSGIWNDQPYDYIARNYHPDHLALLPDKEGACSIADGAGLMRNQGENKPEGFLTKAANTFLKLIGMESHLLSHSELRSDLTSLLEISLNASDDLNTFIEDVFDDFFIYHNDSKLWKQSYNVDENDIATFVGERAEVKRHTEFRTLDGALVSNKHLEKENEMSKKDIVANLIKNTKFEAKDEELLMGMDEEVLNKILPVKNEDEEKPKEEDEVKSTPEEDTKVIPAEGEEEAPAQNAEQYLANAPKEIQGMIRNGLASYAKDKATVIASITANEGNTFTAEQLEAKELPELQALNSLCGKPAVAPTQNNYGFQAPIAQVNNEEHTEEALVAPVMNFDNDKK